MGICRVAYLIAASIAIHPGMAEDEGLLVTGKRITPQGSHTAVGSFPVNLLQTPDGKYVVVTNSGFRQALSVLSTETGALVSQIQVNDRVGGRKEGLYVGLALASAAKGKWTIYASRGAEEKIALYELDGAGNLSDTKRRLADPSPVPGNKQPHFVAGLALSRDGSRLYSVNNNAGVYSKMKGSLSIIDIAANKVERRVELPGFPYAVAAVTKGPFADRKVYVSSERDGVVSVVDPASGKVTRSISTGAQPIALLLDATQDHLFVANAGSDTISIITTADDKVRNTILVRPDNARGLSGATPTGLALAPDEKTLFVTLGDMNCVGVVELPRGKLRGYIPVGWYPTAVSVSADGGKLFVAEGKGVNPQNPNGKPAGPGGKWGQYIQNIIEGTVSVVRLPDKESLSELTVQAMSNNVLKSDSTKANVKMPPGIRHVIYIIKENRTYDQVLGDLPQGNGDPSQCLFGKEVTPNQHALAERFVLLDNFYVCAEVSADGWNWSTAGMASEYTVRNAPYNYSGRGREYDFQGDTNGVPVDLSGIRDVAAPPTKYIWDWVAKKRISFRNYGCFLSEGGEGPDKEPLSRHNAPNKKVLVGNTDENFLLFDMTYADSDAWVILDAPSPKQKRTFGSHNAPSRFSAWKREFDAYVKNKNLPRFTIMALPRDHTAGTSEGLHSPRAMVADNDYALGRIVEEVSKSPYWKSTVIIVLEDDAQNGHDHVDAHRSVCLVISPYVKRNTIDHSFYNTDSALRTIELLLGLPPMSQYDAIAPPFAFIGDKPENIAPYEAILPDRAILAEVNGPKAFGAEQSAQMDFSKADAIDNELLTTILWHAVKGADVPEPPIRRGMFVVMREKEK